MRRGLAQGYVPATSRPDQLFQLDRSVEICKPKQKRFEHDARTGVLAQLAVRVELSHLTEHAQQISSRETLRARREAGLQIRAHIGCVRAIEFCDQQGANRIRQTLVELRDIVSFIEQ